MSCKPGETVGAFLCQAGQVLRAAAIENPRLEARMLLGHAMGTTSEALLREPRVPVPPEAAARFRAAVDARLRATPVAHILGSQGFWTLDLAVSPATLIPRPDSETIVEAALEAFPDPGAPLRVLDLGTGARGSRSSASEVVPMAWLSSSRASSLGFSMAAARSTCPAWQRNAPTLSPGGQLMGGVRPSGYALALYHFNALAGPSPCPSDKCAPPAVAAEFPGRAVRELQDGVSPGTVRNISKSDRPAKRNPTPLNPAPPPAAPPRPRRPVPR